MLELNPELVALLAAALAFLVGEGLQSLGRLLKIDLSGQVAAIASVITAFLVAVINGLFTFIPAEYIPYVKGLLGALVIIFGPAGVHSVLKRVKK